MEPQGPPPEDVGVIVGRFQVPSLHEGHIELIKYVQSRHDKTQIFLGLSPGRVTVDNPLDFESRRRMLQDSFPDIQVLYIHDCNSDEIWSTELDKQIDFHNKPDSTVRLYGGRDAFINHYSGRHPTTELKQQVYVSGTEIRKQISNKSRSSEDFRYGVIWAAYNKYSGPIPTVDVAIWNEDYTELLLARKPKEELYRFIGGFAKGPCYESDARRETQEETNLEITRPEYLGSCEIDDWRYRASKEKIVTLFFEAKKMYGRPQPADDICELKWFDFSRLKDTDIVEEHRPLLQMLRDKKGKSE